MPKIRLKLKEFELEIEAERGESPQIASSIGQQLAGLIAPAADIAEGVPTRKPVANIAPMVDVEPKPAAARVRPKRPSGGNGASTEGALALKHDYERFAAPDQEWTTATKSTWLLKVLKDLGVAEAANSSVIAATFNAHFKEAGTIRTHNVTRDLGKLKGKQVGASGTGDETSWYLLNDGTAAVDKLIQGVLAKRGAVA